MTPGPRFSATTSHSLISRRAISLPSSVFKSMTVLRLLLFKSRKKKLSTFGLSEFHSFLARSPFGGRSIFITSAPSQASIWVQEGPAWSCVKSMTRMPSNAWLISFLPQEPVGRKSAFRQLPQHILATEAGGTRFALPPYRACRSNRLADLRHDLFGEDLQLVEREGIRHARPMHRGDDVVDPETAVQPDHLLRDFRGRAEQETVFQKLGEFVVEIVALGHHLVLPPGAVRLVFLFEIGLGPPYRLGPARRHEDLAAHRQFRREGLAVFVERALVHVHLPLDRRHRVVRVDIPAIGEPRGAADRDIGIGAEPDRRGRLLQRLDRAVRVVKGEMRALHRHEIFGPQPADGFQALLEALAEAAAGHPERLELNFPVADAAAEDELAAGHEVEGGELFGDIERLVQRQ